MTMRWTQRFNSSPGTPEINRVTYWAHREYRRCRPYGLTEDDLVGYGWVGLLEARKRFDATRGIGFKTYAEHRIRGAILDGLRLNSRLGPIRQARRKGIDENGRYHSIDDLPEHSLIKEADQFAHVARRELSDAVASAIDRLPRRQRSVILLRFYDERRQVDIAAIWGLDTSRISQMITAATRRLAMMIARASSGVPPGRSGLGATGPVSII